MGFDLLHSEAVQSSGGWGVVGGADNWDIRATAAVLFHVRALRRWAPQKDHRRWVALATEMKEGGGPPGG
ncbi:hypothetical protein AAFF_G00019600 [Aldrovandia affinis]|uniref:Uncharacterized protein n=1 Tax=Aldrovandia affinis TaxID=143900 RepID=A0AAD7S5M3_9TELE|nr:hypothetical protein AAFF_G00019600 [Aldrovandia affinis]